MFDYWFLLRRRYQTDVFPVALHLSPGAGGVVEERYEVALWGKIQLTFTYHAVGVPDLSADEYAQSQNLLLHGMSTMMKTRPRYARRSKYTEPSNVDRRIQILGDPIMLTTDPVRRQILVAFVEHNLPLTEAETIEYKERTKGNETMQVIMTESMTEAMVKGKAEGVQQSIAQVLEMRFGTLPTDVRKRVEVVQDAAELKDRLTRAMSAASLNDLGLAPA